MKSILQEHGYLTTEENVFLSNHSVPVHPQGGLGPYEPLSPLCQSIDELSLLQVMCR